MTFSIARIANAPCSLPDFAVFWPLVRALLLNDVHSKYEPRRRAVLSPSMATAKQQVESLHISCLVKPILGPQNPLTYYAGSA